MVKGNPLDLLEEIIVLQEKPKKNRKDIKKKLEDLHSILTKANKTAVIAVGDLVKIYGSSISPEILEKALGSKE